jgi:hypothetical protein
VPEVRVVRAVLMRTYAGEKIGTEVEVLGPAPGQGRSFCRTVGGGDAFSADDVALRAVGPDWDECRVVEAKLRTMLAALAGGEVDPRVKVAERAVRYAKRMGLRTWADSGTSKERSAFASLETILRERFHSTGDGTVQVTGVNDPWIVTLWLGVLHEWESDRSMFADPGEKPVLQLAPAPAPAPFPSPEFDEAHGIDLQEPRDEVVLPARKVYARLDDVRLPVRLMEAWADGDEDEFLDCLAVLERQGR